MNIIDLNKGSYEMDYKNLENDFLLKINPNEDININLNNGDNKKIWLMSINESEKNISISVTNKVKQTIVLYLNGTNNSKIFLRAPKGIEELNLVSISENNEKNENVLFDIELNDNTKVNITTLINAQHSKKVIDYKISHNGKKVYSEVKSLGVNNEGYLRHRVNTIVAAPKGGCRQKLKIINFGENADSECDPVLTIHNNDIEYAGHGATIGTYEEEHIFYLMSKGLKQFEAEQLLMKSMINDILSIVEDEAKRNFICAQFLSKVFS